MIFNKIIKILNDIQTSNKFNNKLNKEILDVCKEIEWANIYHDSIRGKKFLEDLPINVGRWAGNYTFFYILNRILNDVKPKKILELGLGESTKFVSAYLLGDLDQSIHTVVEHDLDWIRYFKSRFQLSSRTKVINCELEEVYIKNHSSFSYKSLVEKIDDDFNLYIIDGPYGSDRFSRYDILSIVEKFDKQKSFIILFDDTNRPGERDTVCDILESLSKKDIAFEMADYSGVKTLTLVVSKDNKYLVSL